MQWFFKKQSSVETSVFGTKFVAMKQDIDGLRGLRDKLNMIGIHTSGPSYIYENNMSVIHHPAKQELVIMIKNNSVDFHAVHESVAMGKSSVGKIPT